MLPERGWPHPNADHDRDVISPASGKRPFRSTPETYVTSAQPRPSASDHRATWWFDYPIYHAEKHALELPKSKNSDDDDD